ncbi:MAG TPA: mevalonate kinase, partial [Phaeodactylibacter sp.]|nr:mevalonate kinase [Phaeodactylibacter sp.]
WKVIHYLEQQSIDVIDLAALGQAVAQGDFFSSNIPSGYGLGSSGAVTAALYDRFALRKEEADLKKLRSELAIIESCFHGQSSGLDPLVSFLKKGILFQNGKIDVLANQSQRLDGFFLLDTQIRRETSLLVASYKSMCQEETYKQRIEAELIPLVEDAIDSFLKKDNKDMLALIHHIGFFQWKYFAPMIPERFKTAWLSAIASSHTKLKLCGAGGGGFILGYSTDWEASKKLLKAHPLSAL